MSTAVRKLWPFGWVREIARESGPYLTRWSLRQQYGEGESEKNGGWRAYLHQFFSPDSELHNHPWHWSLSIVLWGSYTERVCEDPEWDEEVSVRHVCWFNWIPRDRYHQIVELHPRAGRVFTLFICGPAHGRSWGFWVPGRGFVNHSKRKTERGLPAGPARCV